MPPSYTVSIKDSAVFRNAYSYIRLSIEPVPDAIRPIMAVLPLSVANDEHIQRVFTPLEGDEGNPNSATFINIYFPFLPWLETLEINLYPTGTQWATISDSDPYVWSWAPASDENIQIKEGSALLLGLEDKEANVRVLQVNKSDQPTIKNPSYMWTGSVIPPDGNTIPNAVAHVTELFDTGFIENVEFNEIKNGTPIPLNKYLDLSTNKYHLYLQTQDDGFATLEAVVPKTPHWGHLIYWPFSDTSSEVARIVFYDPSPFGVNLFGPTPEKNPIILSDYSDEKGPVFRIGNQSDPKIIKDDQFIFFIIEDAYERTYLSASTDNILIMTTTKLIQTNPDNSATPNNARYIYTERSGKILISPKFTFFARRGPATISLLGTTPLPDLDIF